MKPLHVLVAAVCPFFLVPATNAALLSYWDFNNLSPAYTAGSLGSFSATAALYGESYSANSLSSNTANGTVFSGAGISMDFSNLSLNVTNPIINGKVYLSAAQAQTNTVYGGFGAFSDTTVNRVSGDTTTGGSLIIMNPSGSEVGHYIIFTLSSAGYDNLVFSYATRLSSGYAGSEVWQYSLDGTTYYNLTSINPTANATFQSETLDLSALSSKALENQSTFYLKMSISSASNGGSYAFDNIQLTGTAAVVPEPASVGLFLGGLALLTAVRRVRKTDRPVSL